MKIWSYTDNTYDAAKDYVNLEEYEEFVPRKAYGSLEACKAAVLAKVNELRDESSDDCMYEGELPLGHPKQKPLTFADLKDWYDCSSEYNQQTRLKISYDDYYIFTVFDMDLECDELSIKGYN